MEKGQIECIQHRSLVLKNNPHGDPFERQLYVYTPSGFSNEDPLPALLALVGFGGTGAQLLNVDPMGEDLASRMDRLIFSKKCPPCRVVIPDCFNKLGGSQYINSPAVGQYEDYLISEIIPYVESKFKVTSWAVFGKSSGGYGSMVLGLRHPEVFRSLACHSGDSNFELSYLPDFPSALDELKKAGGPQKWLAKMWADKNPKRKKYHKTLNALAMSAHYSPNSRFELGVEFPFDLELGVFKPDVWKRWKEWDPVYLLEKYSDNAKKLKFIYIDCGTQDEFALHWGARAMKQKADSLGLRVHYEEFDDGHMNLSYRYDESLPKLLSVC